MGAISAPICMACLERMGSACGGLAARREMACGPDGGLCPVLGLNFPKNRFDMDLHGGFRDVEFPGDDLVGVAVHQAAQDHRLPHGQALCRRQGIMRFFGSCSFLLLAGTRSEEHTSELQSRQYLVC